MDPIVIISLALGLIALITSLIYCRKRKPAIDIELLGGLNMPKHLYYIRYALAIGSILCCLLCVFSSFRAPNFVIWFLLTMIVVGIYSIFELLFYIAKKLLTVH